jgi:integrase
MDPDLRQRLFQFLSGRQGWKASTLKWAMPRFERMAEMGFNYATFATGLDPAEAEAERFIASLRAAGMKPGGIRNFQKCILALAKFHRHRGFELRLDREARPQPRIYSRRDLDALHGLPFSRRAERRLERALILTHMAFGLRAGELAPMRVSDLDPDASTFHVAFPEKGGPRRTLRVETEVFREARPLMAWLNHRPVPKAAPDALWTRWNAAGTAVPLSLAEMQTTLFQAGQAVNVAANCTRGRHTRLTALVYNGAKLPYVAYFAGHTGPFAASHRYVEMVDADLARHLQGSRWLHKSDPRSAKP